ncbi:MAG: hypothetical protein AABX79_02820 [Nanoarchaeota archaeon]
MDKKQLIAKIMEKPELRELPLEDVKMAFSNFEKKQAGDEEKERLTRELLHKVFGAFGSRKLLVSSLREREPEWILRKHFSTRERLPYYAEVYGRILKGIGEKASILDLGAGVNGFSYKYFKEIGFDVEYTGIEAVGQFVELMNLYFKKKKMKAKALHLSLFQLEEIKKIIGKVKKPIVVFLFKTLDSLEMLERDYSKELLSAISPITDRIAISFATESMTKRKRFKAKRNWITNFIREKFRIIDDFEIAGERYIVLEKNFG